VHLAIKQTRIGFAEVKEQNTMHQHLQEPLQSPIYNVGHVVL